MNMIKRKLVLHFPKEKVDEPITYKLIKEFDLIFNILKAKVTPEEEGLLVLELTGEEKNFNAGIKYLKDIGLKIQPLEKDITRDEKKCTHCSACVVHCPTKALYIKDRKTMKVEFNKEKCIACEACIPLCPVRAMSLEF